MDSGGAFGAGKATGQFDPISFAKKPQVIVRALSWVSTMVLPGVYSLKSMDFPSACPVVDTFTDSVMVSAFAGVLF